VQDIVGHDTLLLAIGDGVSELSNTEVSWPLPIEPSMPENLPGNRPKPTELNPKYVFSICSRFQQSHGHAASLAVAESPGASLIPYLCAVGLG